MRFLLSVTIICCVWLVASSSHAANDVTVTPDVVYGHKHGLAMTMDVFTPADNANGVGVMFMVSGGWFSHWAPPEQAQGLFVPLLQERKFVNHETLSKSFPALKFDADKASDVSPLLHASSDDAPTLMIHGDQDQLVPIHNSTDMLAALKEVKVASELITIEGAAHGFGGEDARRAAAARVAWFDQHLLKE